MDKIVSYCGLIYNENPCSKLDIPFKNSPENKATLDCIREKK